MVQYCSAYAQSKRQGKFVTAVMIPHAKKCDSKCANLTPNLTVVADWSESDNFVRCRRCSDDASRAMRSFHVSEALSRLLLAAHVERFIARRPTAISPPCGLDDLARHEVAECPGWQISKHSASGISRQGSSAKRGRLLRADYYTVALSARGNTIAQSTANFVTILLVASLPECSILHVRDVGSRGVQWTNASSSRRAD